MDDAVGAEDVGGHDVRRAVQLDAAGGADLDAPALNGLGLFAVELDDVGGQDLAGDDVVRQDGGGYANAFAGIALPNDASIALHESFGFTTIGIYRKVGYKQGAWHDVGWWQKSFTHPSNPQDPLKPENKKATP